MAEEVRRLKETCTGHGNSTLSDNLVTSTTESGDGPKTSRPIPVVLAETEEHGFWLDEENLEQVLLQEHVRDKKVVVVSVAGAFRKGKSFLLNFFIRYLYHEGNDDWLGEDDTPLKGFTWCGGSDRDTSGILIWSDVFVCELLSGEKVAVVLMDTQGAFDSQSTVKECATIFALSTMLSSVQVYNLTQNIQEDDLQHLQLFTEYGKLALEDPTCNIRPFQTLQFLVRDWSYPYEAPFGDLGGSKILEKRLQITDKQHPELQTVRQHIRSCFDKIGCFLLPHPGLKVATSPEFDGKLKDIECEFKNQLKTLVPLLLAPQNLVVKEISGTQVTCRGLVEFFKAYINIYKGDELPEPKSMLLATAEANNLAAVATAKDLYTKTMEEVCGGDAPYIAVETLQHLNEKAQNKALDVFRQTKKMGGSDFCKQYEERLSNEIIESFEHFSAQNESKNIFNAARTPAVLFVIMTVFYVLSGVCGLLGLYALANVCNMGLGLTLCVFCIWAYVRYTGNMRDLGSYIDLAADAFWENFLSRAVNHAVTQGVHQGLNRALSVDGSPASTAKKKTH